MMYSIKWKIIVVFIMVLHDPKLNAQSNYCQQHSGKPNGRILKICFSDSSQTDTVLVGEFLVGTDGKLIHDGKYLDWTDKNIRVEGIYKAGIESGVWHYYNFNDNAVLEATYKDNKRKLVKHVARGIGTEKILYKGRLKHFNKEGRWKYYDKLGNLEKIENYIILSSHEVLTKKIGNVNVFPWGYASFRHGSWKYYENKKLIKIEYYKFNELINTKLK